MTDLKEVARGLGLAECELRAFVEQQRKAQKKSPLEAIKEAWENLKTVFGVKSEPEGDELPARPTVYDYRRRGRDYCQTDGSDHYQHGDIEPIDLIIALGLADGFCLGNVIKYAARYSRTGDTEDLRKAADYLHILAGVELAKEGDK